MNFFAVNPLGNNKSSAETYPQLEKWETTFMASAEHKPVLGVWGFAPVRSRGKAPGHGGFALTSKADEISAVQNSDTDVAIKIISNLVK
jgi:hypothetical protein